MTERWLSVKEFRPTVSGIGKVAVHPKGGSMFSYYDRKTRSWSVPCADEAAALNLKATPFKWPKGVIGFYTSSSPSESITMSKLLPSSLALRAAFGVGTLRKPGTIPMPIAAPAKKRSNKDDVVVIVALKKPAKAVKPAGRVQFHSWTNENHDAFAAAVIAAAVEAGKGGDISLLAKENGGQLCKFDALVGVIGWCVENALIIVNSPDDLDEVEHGTPIEVTALKAGRAFLKSQSSDDEDEVDVKAPAKKRASPIGQDDDDIVMKPVKKTAAKAPVHGRDNVAGAKPPKLQMGKWANARLHPPTKALTSCQVILKHADGSRENGVQSQFDGESFLTVKGKPFTKGTVAVLWRAPTPQSLKELAVWTKKHGG